MGDWYDVSGAPANNAQLSSATMRSEFALVQTAMNKLPTLTGNGSKPIFVNAGATALETVTASTARSRLGLVIGTDVQAYDAELAAIAGLTSATNKLPYFTGSGTASLADFTAAGRALVDDADASAQRTTLGLGTMATQSAAAVAITGGSASSLTLTSPTISGGTIDGTTIGGTTAAAATVNDLVITNPQANKYMVATGAGTDAKRWREVIDTSGNLIIQTRTDANGGGQTLLTASRSGTTIGTVNFNSGTLQSQGNTVYHAGNVTPDLTAVTSTAAELNKTDDSAAAVSGYVSGIRTYIKESGGHSTSFDVSANVTESTFESIGPTGSGATNIWTAMDDIPSNARVAIIRCSFYALGDESATNILGSVYARMTGNAASASNVNRINRIQKDNNNLTEVPEDANITEVHIPLDSSRRFDITWSCINDAAVNIGIYLVGFVL